MRENIFVHSKEEVISELKRYKQAGGGTICDVTPIGMRYIACM